MTSPKGASPIASNKVGVANLERREAALPPLVLASASPRRAQLLEQIGVHPEYFEAADIDETPLKSELPRDYVGRLAREKAAKIAEGRPGAFILSGDTAVACGRRILPKAEEPEHARDCLALLSGRSHRVWTGVCLINPTGRQSTRIVESRVKVRRLSSPDIEAYIKSDEWRGKAGGYAIQGRFGAHIISIIGSYSSVVGLPLYETMNLLRGEGFKL